MPNGADGESVKVRKGSRGCLWGKRELGLGLNRDVGFEG